MKILDHTVLLQIDSNRELFTTHGLHMNDKGKELAAKKIASTIKYIR
jgi:lysophospholipase L1-like esterase